MNTKKPLRYSANRCSVYGPRGEDMENRCFSRKAEAVRWAAAYGWGKVRDYGSAVRPAPVIFEKVGFNDGGI